MVPLFVREGVSEPVPIASMPGIYQHTLESLVKETAELKNRNICGVILFGVPQKKDAKGSEAYNPKGIVQMAIKELKENFQDEIVVMADLCVDEYTDHGHCGVLDSRGRVDNDATLEIYAQIAGVQAKAGADVIAPSGMMDGQVAAIRSALDKGSYEMTAIMAYSAKYGSAHYGPFREAVSVEIAGNGDRRDYQQDPPNLKEALGEIRQDLQEGADIVMVKPALSYLDVIATAKAELVVPLAAYNVSGEYAMVKAAAQAGWLDGAAVAMEHLLSIKRAGADIILTYFAKEVAEAL